MNPKRDNKGGATASIAGNFLVWQPSPPQRNGFAVGNEATQRFLPGRDKSSVTFCPALEIRRVKNVSVSSCDVKFEAWGRGLTEPCQHLPQPSSRAAARDRQLERDWTL